MSRHYLAAALAVVIFSSAVLANGAPPPRPVVLNSADAKLVVLVDPNIKKPILKVPSNLLGQKKEAPGKIGGQGLLDNPGLIVIGLALTGAFITGGFWLLRGKTGRRAAALLCIVCLTVAGSAVWADIGFPSRPVLKPLALPGNVHLSGEVTIEVIGNKFFASDTIELVIPGEKPVQKPEPKTDPKPE